MTPRSNIEKARRSPPNESLEFRQIADLWSQEGEGPTRDETLQRLISAVWLGNFEDGSGKTCLTLDSVGETDKSFNRRELLTAMKSLPALEHLGVPEGAFIPDTHYLAAQNKRRGAKLWPNIESWDSQMAGPWELVRDEVPWQRLAALRLDQYTPEKREPYLERLSISKGDFRRWCSQRKLDLPEFWFEGDAQPASPPDGEPRPAKRRGRPKGSGMINDSKPLEKMRELTGGEDAVNPHRAAGMAIDDPNIRVKGIERASTIKRLIGKFKKLESK